MEDQLVPDSDIPASTSYAEVPASDLPKDNQEVPKEDIPSEKKDFSSPVQQGIAALEGAAKGATFGLSTKAETALGVPAEDIKARQEENPLIAVGSDTAGTIGSMFVPGVGEGWIAGKAAKLAIPIAENASRIAKVGRLALRGMAETMGFAAGDEISDAFLDKGHDAEAVASHIAGAGAVGLLTGGLMAGTGQGLEHIQNSNLGEYLDNFAIGLGSASEGGTSAENIANIYNDAGLKVPKGMIHGMKFFDDTSNKIAKTIADSGSKAAGSVAGGAAGTALGTVLGPLGATGGAAAGARLGYKAAEKWLDPLAERLASKAAPTLTKKVAVPIMLQALKLGEYSGLSNALNYGTKAAKGAKLINQSLDSLFKVGGSKALSFELSDKDRDKLDKYIENGGIDQQIQEFKNTSDMNGYAKGGVVHPKPLSSDGISKLYPSQHVMITAAKGRVSNYLNGVRPQQPSQLMFDKKDKDPIQQKSYNRALDIANQPLSVLKHIQDGTLQTEHVKHLASMYPEVHDHLAKKITERLMNQKVDDEKPSYRVRQGLSLFIGAPLETTFTAPAIQAAQSGFLPKTRQQAATAQPQGKIKKGTSTLGKDNKTYKTASQAAESDRTARD